MNKKKNKNQFLVYMMALCIMLAIFLLTSIILTQYIAHVFNYHPNLGPTLFGKFYSPHYWILWTYSYQSTYPDFFTKILIYAGLGIFTGFISFVITRLLFLRAGGDGVADLHGSARWAKLDDIKKMAILDNEDGVYIGGYTDPKSKQIKYLKHSGPEHIVAFAPTRSGKGVGLVLPTLLSYVHSTLIVDIKGELWALTSGWRDKYADNITFMFNPFCTDGTGAKFNILKEIRINTVNEIGDATAIANDLVWQGLPPDSKNHFANMCIGFLRGIIIFLLQEAHREGKKTPSLTDLYELLNNPNFPVRDLEDPEKETLVKKLMNAENYTNPKLKDTMSAMKSVGSSMFNVKSENEFSGYVSSMTKALTLYADSRIKNNIDDSDFTIMDIMNADKPVSLYLVIQPRDQDVLMPFVNMFVSQIFKTLVDNMKFEGGTSKQVHKHKLLFMADEFTSLGNLPTVEKNMAYMAGYGLKTYLIFQDLTQLNKLYSQDEAIISNAHVRIAYAPNKIQTAELLSKMAGTTTIVKKSITTSGKRMSVIQGNSSETINEVQRPLITPQECMSLKAPQKNAKGEIEKSGDMLIFIAGQYPIYGTQILYFQEKSFLDRAKVKLEYTKEDLVTTSVVIIKDDFGNEKERRKVKRYTLNTELQGKETLYYGYIQTEIDPKNKNEVESIVIEELAETFEIKPRQVEVEEVENTNKEIQDLDQELKEEFQELNSEEEQEKEDFKEIDKETECQM